MQTHNTTDSKVAQLLTILEFKRMSKRLNVGSKRKKLFNLASVVLHTAGMSVGDPFITHSQLSVQPSHGSYCNFIK